GRLRDLPPPLAVVSGLRRGRVSRARHQRCAPAAGGPAVAAGLGKRFDGRRGAGLMRPIDLAEKGLVPDWLIRRGIRALLRRRLEDERIDDPEAQSQRYQALIDELAQSAIAIEADAANEQHYEIPAIFYQHVLGRRLKYSSALWAPGVEDL